jgi:hypothetical protein
LASLLAAPPKYSGVVVSAIDCGALLGAVCSTPSM